MVARSVGAPTRENCGQCHFFGGGGNAVKHGDLDTSLLDPERDYDVHMSADGADMTCQDCHTTEQHAIAGNALVASPSGYHRLECTSCHDEDVHDKKVLNWHVRSLACQSCHIPRFAKSRPTKVWWDWSDAGKDLPVVEDQYGQPTFDKKKGSFRWAKDIIPTYAWFNGTAGSYHLGERMNPAGVTRLNWPNGSVADAKAKIYPFKIHSGKQPYDIEQRIFANPLLFGPDGFWSTFDWQSATAAGMKAAGLEFSGEVGFAQTLMYWKINHMVVPADQSLTCNDCHATEGGRMDWQALGYAGDPMRERGISRYSMSEVYE
jgi:octaheme c-type cytochrome (tetrathionate reductase family)